MNKTGYIYHPIYLEHETGSHPENSGRLEAINRRLQGSDIFPHLQQPAPRPATIEEIALNHEAGYVHQVSAACNSGVSNLDGDTVISAQSYDAALTSAGAGLTRFLVGCRNRPLEGLKQPPVIVGATSPQAILP